MCLDLKKKTTKSELIPFLQISSFEDLKTKFNIQFSSWSCIKFFSFPFNVPMFLAEARRHVEVVEP